MDSEQGRLVHSIEFLKNQYDFCEFVIALLSLNISIEEMYQVIYILKDIESLRLGWIKVTEKQESVVT